MFYEGEDSYIENYADDTASKLFPWFNNNHMKANPEKSHLLLSFKTPKKAYFGGALVESSSTEKLLGIQIGSDIIFGEHISSICNKVGKKTDVLCRLVHYMSFDKRRMVMKTFTRFFYEQHFYTQRQAETDTKLIHFKPMFHLWKNQVVGFY